MKKYIEFLEEVRYFILGEKIVPVLKDEQGRTYIEVPDEGEEKVAAEEKKKKGGKSE